MIAGDLIVLGISAALAGVSWYAEIRGFVELATDDDEPEYIRPEKCPACDEPTPADAEPPFECARCGENYHAVIRGSGSFVLNTDDRSTVVIECPTRIAPAQAKYVRETWERETGIRAILLDGGMRVAGKMQAPDVAMLCPECGLLRVHKIDCPRSAGFGFEPGERTVDGGTIRDHAAPHRARRIGEFDSDSVSRVRQSELETDPGESS
ncbi:MAG: hypothetical protein GY715_05810 [Planctomycetes bacterium]|nr:hypothetical protein [Planctomycetota bacterium]